MTLVDELHERIEDGELRELYHVEELSIKKIAERYDVSRSTLRRVVVRRGIERRDPQSPNVKNRRYHDKEVLEESYSEEKSLSDIAEEFDCTPTTISNWLAKHGIREKQNDPNPHPNYRFEGYHGYPTIGADGHNVPVHNLVAIADGADPEVVFGDPMTHVHHENGHKFDNRPSNLTLISAQDHGRIDADRDSTPYSTKDVLLLIDFMLSPQSYID